MQKYLLFLLLCLTQNIVAQQYWSKNYDFFNGRDFASKVIRTPKGVAVTPWGYCDKNSKDCVGIMEIDLNGDLLNETVLYESIKNNHEESMVFWKDTFWLHVNYIHDSLDRRAILSFDKNGQYAHRYIYTYPSQKDFNYARQIDALGNRMFITFDSKDTLTKVVKVIIRALDEHLNTLWEHSLPTFYKYPIWDNIRATPDGGVIAINSTTQNWRTRALITKYDADGNVTWKTPFERDFDRYAENVKINNHPDGGYVGLWEADSFVIFNYNNPAIVFKMDATGQFEWQKVDFYHVRNIFDVFAAQNGDLVMCGTDEALPQEQDQYFAAYLRRMTAQGAVKWERRIFDHRDDSKYNYLWGGLELENGDLMFTGSWNPHESSPPQSDTFPDNVWLLKVDSNGCFTPNCDTNQYIVPTQEAPARRQDGAFAAFPNPFGHTLTLASVIGQPLPPGDYQAAVYDALGQQVARRDIHPELLTVFELEGLPPGTYTVVVFRDGAVVQTMTAMKQ